MKLSPSPYFLYTLCIITIIGVLLMFGLFAIDAT
jgi:hypothetical protein